MFLVSVLYHLILITIFFITLKISDISLILIALIFILMKLSTFFTSFICKLKVILQVLMKLRCIALDFLFDLKSLSYHRWYICQYLLQSWDSRFLSKLGNLHSGSISFKIFWRFWCHSCAKCWSTFTLI